MQAPEDNLDTLQDIESRALRCKNGTLRFGDHHNNPSKVKASKCTSSCFHGLCLRYNDSKEHNPHLQFIPYVGIQIIFFPWYCLVLLSYLRKIQPFSEDRHAANMSLKQCFAAPEQLCRGSWYTGKTVMVPCHENCVSTTCRTTQLDVGWRQN